MKRTRVLPPEDYPVIEGPMPRDRFIDGREPLPKWCAPRSGNPEKLAHDATAAWFGALGGLLFVVWPRKRR